VEVNDVQQMRGLAMPHADAWQSLADHQDVRLHCVCAAAVVHSWRMPQTLHRRTAAAAVGVSSHLLDAVR